MLGPTIVINVGKNANAIAMPLERPGLRCNGGTTRQMNSYTTAGSSEISNEPISSPNCSGPIVFPLIALL